MMPSFPLLLVLLAVGCSLAASATAATDSLVVVPVRSLYGGAAWAINTRIGTPPIDYGLYMDTGSSDLIVSKTNCVGCSPYGRRYNPTASSSAKGTPCNAPAPVECTGCINATCTDSVQYAGPPVENATFQLYQDRFQVAGVSSPVGVGAIFEYQNLPPPPTTPAPRVLTARHLLAAAGGNLQDGLVGLAFPQLSASHSPNFVLRYATAGLISTPTFCTCLNQTGGLLAVGGVADFMGPPASIQWTPLLPGGFYRVNVTTVNFGTKPVSVPPHTYSLAIVDSGTPGISLPPVALKSLMARMQSTCGTPHELHGVCGGTTIFDGACVAFTPAQLAQFPPLSFSIDAGDASPVLIELQPHQYLVKGYVSCGSADESAFVVGPEKGWTVLGGPVLQAYRAAFDMERKRIGWAFGHGNTACEPSNNNNNNMKA